MVGVYVGGMQLLATMAGVQGLCGGACSCWQQWRVCRVYVGGGHAAVGNNGECATPNVGYK